MDFAHYQSPKMLGTSPLSHINMASLGQTCGDYAGKIWDVRLKETSPIVWDLPDIRKPGLTIARIHPSPESLKKHKQAALF